MTLLQITQLKQSIRASIQCHNLHTGTKYTSVLSKVLVLGLCKIAARAHFCCVYCSCLFSIDVKGNTLPGYRLTSNRTEVPVGKVTHNQSNDISLDIPDTAL